MKLSTPWQIPVSPSTDSFEGKQKRKQDSLYFTLENDTYINEKKASDVYRNIGLLSVKDEL